MAFLFQFYLKVADVSNEVNGNGLNFVEKQELKSDENHMNPKGENWKKKTTEIVIPFFISGLGMVAAGILFGQIEVSISI